ILSDVPHALLKGIVADEALKIPKVVDVVTAKDIPGENQVGYALPDQPLFPERKIRFHGEPLGLILAEEPEKALEAVNYVKVIYEELPALLDPLDAMRRTDVLVHDELGSNIAFRTKVRKGDVEVGFSRSDVIVENTYRTQHQEHVYLETEGALAIPEEQGRMTIISCAQYPHLAQAIVARVLGAPRTKVRIVQPFIGGAFGGKDDIGPIVAAQAAVAAYKTGRPVMLIYSREDSIRSHPKREASIIKYKSGASKDGKLMAIEVEIIMDTGAYANRGPFILWRATMHASGPYEVPHAKVDGFCVYTNKVYQGSFRGFGNPDIQFAAEAQMDELAKKLGMDPVEFRLRNVLRPGSYTITNQKLDHSVGVGEALRLVALKADWSRKYKEYSKGVGRFRRGIGVACAWHGISTSRGVPDWSNAIVKIEKDGSVHVFTGIVEMGQGSPTTSHIQIVSEVLGIPTDLINIYHGSSDAPDTGATHASRGTSIGAIGVLVAAAKLRERLNKLASEVLGCKPGDVVIREGKVFPKDNPKKSIEWRELIKLAYERGVEMSATGYFFLPKGTFDHERGQGFAYPAFSYIVMIAEVEVDIETGMVRVLKVWPALAAGKIINPLAVEGQVEGAIAQGLGLAIMEKVEIGPRGEVLNPNLTDYVVPTTTDMPEVEKPIYVEDLFRYGPFGAKGVGEMALIPMPAAVANAVSHALGKRVTELPLTPERVYFMIKKG
ncbi:MAG: aldehyde oxidase, partial [Thermoprotei archaeon]